MPDTVEEFSFAELTLAARSHGLLLEALRERVTPLGLHYLLNHFDVPPVDHESFRLVVDGLVGRPLSLTLADLRARPATELTATMECAGNGRAHVTPRPRTQPWIDTAVGTAVWRGTRLRPLLEEAGLLPAVQELVFVGLDRGIEGGIEQDYARSLPVAEALDGEAVLAYEVNGVPLPPQHGFPLRVVVPGWYGMANVKWLARITAVAQPFEGYYQTQAYCLRSAPGEPGVQLNRMLPRALMAPPGIPEFPSRRRYLDGGPCVLDGRAWSGLAPIATVEVSVDGGASWAQAALGREDARWAWRGWQLAWTPPGQGVYELVCRASDRQGNTQPLEAAWNVGGYANNAVQRVQVTVR